MYAADLPNFNYLLDSQAIKEAKNQFIQDWAIKQLMVQNTLDNLPEEVQWKLDQLVENYRIDLYTKSYFDLISFNPADTLIGENELQELYDREQQSMRLDQDIVKLRYIALNATYTKPDEVMNRFKRYNKEDQRFIDSLGVHNYLKEIQLNDSVWLKSSAIAKRINPITYQNITNYLQDYQFFDIRDSTGFYFGQVLDTRKKGDIAPYAFAQIELKQIIQNRKRFDRLERQKQDMVSEAIRKKNYETYE
ncbi:MAG: hypothetical protein O3A09_03290 [Bacteroidetes bacterium]|nr:hypothetical protein [Bacteroidota bacterium]